MVKINEGNTKVGPQGLTELNPEGLHVFASPSESRAGRVHITLVQHIRNVDSSDPTNEAATIAQQVLEKDPLKPVVWDGLTALCTCTGYENHKKCWHVEHALYKVRNGTLPGD